jgi:hypothetical protein
VHAVSVELSEPTRHVYNRGDIYRTRLVREPIRGQQGRRCDRKVGQLFKRARVGENGMGPSGFPCVPRRVRARNVAYGYEWGEDEVVEFGGDCPDGWVV